MTPPRTPGSEPPSRPPDERLAAKSRTPERTAQQRRWAWPIWVALAAAAAGLWLVFAMLPRWLESVPPAETAPAAQAGVDSRRIRATLYYVSASGDGLVAVDREVPYAASPADQARRIIET